MDGGILAEECSARLNTCRGVKYWIFSVHLSFTVGLRSEYKHGTLDGDQKKSFLSGKRNSGSKQRNSDSPGLHKKASPYHNNDDLAAYPCHKITRLSR